MEINVTAFVSDNPMENFQSSRAESGRQDIGSVCWNNAKIASKAYSFVTEENKQEFIDWFSEFGAWTEEEMKEWDLTHLNALLLQFVAGDMRERENMDDDEIEAAEQAGQISSRLYKHEGQYYFNIGL